MTKQELEVAVQTAQLQLTKAIQALNAFVSSPGNNIYSTLDDALCTVEERLLEQARNDCEGSYNCGAYEYTQEFIVDGKHYIGTLNCDYNRHDKTYYYLDEHTFKYAELS